MTSKRNNTLKRVFSRHNMVVFAAMATSLASDVASPPDNIEPGLVKDELILSSIAKKPASGSMTGKGSAGGEKPLLQEGQKFDFERKDLLDSLQIAKVPFVQTAQFFKNYNENLDEDGKISSKYLAKAAKDAKISTPKFKVIVEELRKISKLKKLDKVSQKGINGYDYFDQPIEFIISDKGELKFTSKIITSNLQEYNQDISEINKVIEKTKRLEGDVINLEANDLLLKAYACAEARKIIDDEKEITNSDKLFDSFAKDLDYYKLSIREDGKFEHKPKIVKLNTVISMLSTKNSYRAAG